MQDQNIEGSRIEHSAVQQAQAGQNAVSFQNSHDNQVTINTVIWRLFGQSPAPVVDWDWAQRLKDKQLPEIRKRLIDTLGRDRTLMQISLDEQLGWVGRSPLQVNRRLQVQGEDQGLLNWQQMLIETFGREDVDGKLLILGTPGAGKTTALLSLAEQLVCGVLDQPKTVIPVLVELSTWREGQRIEDWLVEQLYDLYPSDRKAKRYEKWLEQQVLLPLMDGLDELGLERQKQCTLKLNEFARHYPRLVVCCRVKEFAQANVNLNNLRGSVCLEPLTDEQIQDYLKCVDRLSLWSSIQTTPILKALLEPDKDGDPGLLRVPLFLTLTASAYDAQCPFQTREELLELYIERQLSREVRESDRRKETDRRQWEYKNSAQEPDRRKTLRTLQWIATVLKENNQVEFWIENIQPYYLNNRLHQWLYWLLLFVGNLLITGTIATLLVLRFFLENNSVSQLSILSIAFSFALIGGFIATTENTFDGANLLIYPLAELLYFIFRKEALKEYRKNMPVLHAINFSYRFQVRFPSLNDLKNKVLYPCLGGFTLITNYYFTLPIFFVNEINQILGEALNLPGISKLSAALRKSYNQADQEVINAAGVHRYPYHALVIAAVMSAQCVQQIRMKGGWLVNLAFNVFVSFPVFVAVVFFLPINIVFAFLQDIDEPLIPNQGLKEHLKFSFLILFFLLFSLYLMPFEMLDFCHQIISLGLGILACLSFLSLLKHLCLRFVLWQSGIAPWQLARFLNYCVERRLLQRVGGRYRFLHRELLDHFAGQKSAA